VSEFPRWLERVTVGSDSAEDADVFGEEAGVASLVATTVDKLSLLAQVVWLAATRTELAGVGQQANVRRRTWKQRKGQACLL